jgi:serine/threonine protein kinase
VGFQPGESFDRYVIQSLLGEGGMGRVYRAKDTRLQRNVALKILRPPGEVSEGRAASSGSFGSASYSDGPARLLREARAAAALDHPNAVSIFDVGEVLGTPYIAMELIEGRSLRSYVGDTSVPRERRIRWLVDIAHALAAAHNRGLVHRDVKPENVMIRTDGVVKVLDFGIARRVLLKDDERSSVMDDEQRAILSTMTQSGSLVGTPLYMAPEQLRGEPTDGRADQFAWGVVAYELLTGKAPWDGSGTGLKLVSEILSKDPPRCGDLPAAAEATVRKALAKSPRDRFDAMEDVAVALEAFGSWSSRDVTVLASTEPPPPAMESGRMETPSAATLAIAKTKSPRRARALALGGALLVALGVAALAFRSSALRGEAESASTSASSAPSAARARPTSTALTDLPPAKSASAEASASYLAGLQGIRDASLLSAVASLRRAVALDPTMAPAHVHLAWLYAAQREMQSARGHFQSAMQLRASMSERDRAVLDATEPFVLREPADLDEAEKRMTAASARWPGDAELAFFLGRYRQLLGRTAAATEAFDHALANDPKLALVWWARAIDGEDAGDFDAALAAYARCLELSPGAASCLRSRSTIHAQRGDCADVEADARRTIAIEPSGYRAYDFLARALCARGRPLETVREVLNQKWALYPEEHRAARRLADLAQLALLQGDFKTAEKHALALEALVTSAQTELEHVEPVRLLVDTYVEMGDVARAVRVAETFRSRRDAWVATRAYGDSALNNALPELLAMSRRGGAISREAFDAKRSDWLRDAKASGSPLWARELWVPAYAAPAETKEEALSALAALPAFAPLPPARDLTMADAATGKVYLLADRAADALPYLRRAAVTCLALDEPVAHTRAHWLLGQALEASGDVAGACAAYDVVEQRWGAAIPRSVTGQKARARSRALGCAKDANKK